MNKALYIQEISNSISLFDTKRLKEILNFVNFLKYQDNIDPTLEILENEEWYNKVKLGIEEKSRSEVVDWNSLQ